MSDSEQRPVEAVAVGVDIAKDTFDVSVEVNGKTKTKQFSNTPSGYAKLSQWLGHLKLGQVQVHACLEATGQYAEGLAEHLHAQGHTVSILRTQESNRLHSLGASQTLGEASDTRVVRESITHMLNSLDQQIAELQQHIRDRIDQHPDLARQVALIESIPGLGEHTAAKLLAEFVNARSLAAWAGVTPTAYRSGTSVRGKSRMSKIGNASVRGALYWPAISAMQHNPIVIAFVEPMRKAHKPNMAIIVAVMRKLLHLVYGVIKNNPPFHPHWRTITS